MCSWPELFVLQFIENIIEDGCLVPGSISLKLDWLVLGFFLIGQYLWDKHINQVLVNTQRELYSKDSELCHEVKRPEL